MSGEAAVQRRLQTYVQAAAQQWTAETKHEEKEDQSQAAVAELQQLLKDVGGLPALLRPATSFPCEGEQRRTLQAALVLALRCLPALKDEVSVASVILDAVQRCVTECRQQANSDDELGPVLPLVLLTAMSDALQRCDPPLSSPPQLYLSLLQQDAFLTALLALAAADPSLEPVLTGLFTAVARIDAAAAVTLQASLLSVLPVDTEVGRPLSSARLSALRVYIELCCDPAKAASRSFVAAVVSALCGLYGEQQREVEWRLAVIRMLERMLRGADSSSIPPHSLQEISSLVLQPAFELWRGTEQEQDGWLLCPLLRLLEAMASSASRAALDAKHGDMAEQHPWAAADAVLGLLVLAFDSECEELVHCAIRATAAVTCVSVGAFLHLASSPEDGSVMEQLCSRLADSSDLLQRSATVAIARILAAHASASTADSKPAAAVLSMKWRLLQAMGVTADNRTDWLSELLQSPYQQTRDVANTLLRSLHRLPAALSAALTIPAADSAAADKSAADEDDERADSSDPAPLNAAVWPFVLSRCQRLLQSDAEVQSHALPSESEKAALRQCSSTVQLMQRVLQPLA